MEKTKEISGNLHPKAELIGVVNVEEIKKSQEQKLEDPANKMVLQKSLKIGLTISVLLLLLGFWKKYFFYLIPLPPLIVFASWKVKIFAEKIEKSHPL